MLSLSECNCINKINNKQFNKVIIKKNHINEIQHQ